MKINISLANCIFTALKYEFLGFIVNVEDLLFTKKRNQELNSFTYLKRHKMFSRPDKFLL